MSLSKINDTFLFLLKRSAIFDFFVKELTHKFGQIFNFFLNFFYSLGRHRSVVWTLFENFIKIRVIEPPLTTFDCFKNRMKTFSG